MIYGTHRESVLKSLLADSSGHIQRCTARESLLLSGLINGLSLNVVRGEAECGQREFLRPVLAVNMKDLKSVRDSPEEERKKNGKQKATRCYYHPQVWYWGGGPSCCVPALILKMMHIIISIGVSRCQGISSSSSAEYWLEEWLSPLLSLTLTLLLPDLISLSDGSWKVFHLCFGCVQFAKPTSTTKKKSVVRF